MRVLAFLCGVVSVVLSSQSAHAQAFGHDMWTNAFQSRGLFTPHMDDCSGSESFIEMGPGADLGFCIENAERTAAYWEAARQTCAAAGKRLPEPAEFKYACLNAPGGLSNMSDDMEWATNFVTYHLGDSGAARNSVVAVIGGDGGCNVGAADIVTTADGSTEVTRVFRCVR